MRRIDERLLLAERQDASSDNPCYPGLMHVRGQTASDYWSAQLMTWAGLVRLTIDSSSVEVSN